ncbi:TITAN-like protein isoform X2 [Ricinus communis]|uniref:TITAN-like protein isoform X2 n=1 Tax=Ricinus communis TaxID=3988 RepID=UPI0007729AD0|nr:TITAN-like protein isoform X2 [Ricinus communis]|eukprot:XP_015581343.1 TITAN-like protein isoform X2 [Ricinus communis]
MKQKINNGFEFCKVCNLNHDQGQRHKYFPNHKKSLSAFLSRFQNKLADIRFFLKNPSLLRPEHSYRNRLWCVFCDTDIIEIGSSFACANAINHLASADHLKNLKHFLWKCGGGMDRLDTFRILESDVDKWEKKCKSLKNEGASSSDEFCVLKIGPSNDIQNELNCRNINEFENNTFDPLKSNVSNGVMPLLYYTNEYQISQSAVTNAGSFLFDTVSPLPVDACSSTSLLSSNDLTVNWKSQQLLPYERVISCNLSGKQPCHSYEGKGMVKGASSSMDSQHMTQISTMPAKEAGINVHSGAPPPWLEATEENQLNVQLRPISSSFISLSNKPRKKLNPNRVGAAWAERRKIEMELEKRGEIVSNYEINWLPDFGRVWQSGSRRESRKEFEKEKQKLSKVESPSDMPITIQPYISKRMRRDACE